MSVLLLLVNRIAKPCEVVLICVGGNAKTDGFATICAEAEAHKSTHRKSSFFMGGESVSKFEASGWGCLSLLA